MPCRTESAHTATRPMHTPEDQTERGSWYYDMSQGACAWTWTSTGLFSSLHWEVEESTNSTIPAFSNRLPCWERTNWHGKVTQIIIILKAIWYKRGRRFCMLRLSPYGWSTWKWFGMPIFCSSRLLSVMMMGMTHELWQNKVIIISCLDSNISLM